MELLKMTKRLSVFLLAIGLFANSAFATIIVGNDLPTSFESTDGSHPESDTDIFLYVEQEDFVLQSDLNVDFLAATSDIGVISTGTSINSYIFNFDAVDVFLDENLDWARGSFNFIDSYLFDTDILAIIWSGSRNPIDGEPDSNLFLDASDSILASSGTSYSSGTLGRGLELEDKFKAGNTQDTFTVTGNKIDMSLFVRAPYADQFRVITAAKIPEPTALLLFGTALCLFGFRRFSK